MKNTNIDTIFLGTVFIFLFFVPFFGSKSAVAIFFDVKKYVLFDKIYIYEPILAIITFIEVSKGIKISRPD